jgi:hypothetical protein
MANSTYDNMWQTAMGELSEQLHVEGVDDGDDGLDGGNEVTGIALLWEIAFDLTFYARLCF